MLLVIAGLIGARPAAACDVTFKQSPAFAALEERLAAWRRVGTTLAGRVWESGALVPPGRTGGCDGAALAATIASEMHAGSIVLLGEVHDNGEHHALRGALIEARGEIAGEVASSARSAAAVVEHVRAEQARALSRFVDFNARAAQPGTVDDLFRILEWDKSGWPEKKLFRPLYDALIRAKLPIYAGDPSRETIKRVAKEGEAVLPEEERQRLGLDKPLSPAAQEGLLDDLERSHCGLMPKTAFGKLAFAQRYRDAHLADAVLAAADRHGPVILFAGNGHVRADRGVPWYIHERLPGKKVVTVMLVEVEDGKTKPEDYDLKGDDGKPVADFVVFTPRADRPDPCEDMRKMFEKKSGKGG